jgi:hypothetical protein
LLVAATRYPSGGQLNVGTAENVAEVLELAGVVYTMTVPVETPPVGRTVEVKA